MKGKYTNMDEVKYQNYKRLRKANPELPPAHWQDLFPDYQVLEERLMEEGETAHNNELAEIIYNEWNFNDVPVVDV